VKDERLCKWASRLSLLLWSWDALLFLSLFSLLLPRLLPRDSSGCTSQGQIACAEANVDGFNVKVKELQVGKASVQGECAKITSSASNGNIPLVKSDLRTGDLDQVSKGRYPSSMNSCSGFV
jgi:hypothetical protein